MRISCPECGKVLTLWVYNIVDGNAPHVRPRYCIEYKCRACGCKKEQVFATKAEQKAAAKSLENAYPIKAEALSRIEYERLVTYRPRYGLDAKFILPEDD